MNRKNPGHLIEVLWPKHTMHLISGSSGTWKTAMLFSIIRDWEAGRKIFNIYQSFPCEWQYVAFDRDLNETWATLDTIRYAPDEKRIHSAYGSKLATYDQAGIIRTMMKLLPKGGLFIADGLHFIAPRSSEGQFQATGEFVRSLRLAAERLDITIAGVCHNSKARKGEEYTHPRDRIMGSAAWGATTGTLLALENRGDDEDAKTLWVCPRTAKEYKCTVTRDMDGRIVVRQNDTKKGEISAQASAELDEMFEKIPAEEEIQIKALIEWGLDNDRSTATIERWVKKLVEDGKVTRVKRGVYKKTTVN